jgi:hypothetical protein
MSSIEESKAVALRCGEVWHQGTVDDLDTIFASDFVDHAPSGEVLPGLENFKARWHLLKGTFPDLTFAYQHLIAEGGVCRAALAREREAPGGISGLSSNAPAGLLAWQHRLSGGAGQNCGALDLSRFREPHQATTWGNHDGLVISPARNGAAR